MSDAILDAARVARLARLTGFPPVTLAGRVWRGPDDWNELLRAATRGDRGTLIGRLRRPLMLHTDVARRNFRRWAGTGAPIPPADARPDIHGDAELVPGIEAGVRALPACVRWHVLTFVAFESVGVSSCAWVGPRAPRPIIVRLGPAADLFMIRHELGHAWAHQDPEALNPLPSSRAWLAALSSTKAAGGARVQAYDDGEWLADALAWAWGDQGS